MLFLLQTHALSFIKRLIPVSRFATNANVRFLYALPCKDKCKYPNYPKIDGFGQFWSVIFGVFSLSIKTLIWVSLLYKLCISLWFYLIIKKHNKGDLEDPIWTVSPAAWKTNELGNFIKYVPDVIGKYGKMGVTQFNTHTYTEKFMIPWLKLQCQCCDIQKFCKLYIRLVNRR